MSAVPIADSDIVGWSPEYLALRRVTDLKKLIERLKLKFPDVDAEERPEGRRGKKGFDKAEHVALLLAKRAAVVATQGGNGSAADNTSAASGFIMYGAVQFQQTDGGSWQRAVITAIADNEGTPLYNVRVTSASGIVHNYLDIPGRKLRIVPTSPGNASNIPALPTLDSGDTVQLRGAAGAGKPLGVVIEVLAAPAAKPYRVRMDGASTSTLYTRADLVLPSQTPPAAGGGPASDPPTGGGGGGSGAPRISSSVLDAAGVGGSGVPGQHTKDGMGATQDVPPPGTGDSSGSGSSGAGGGSGGTDNSATWRALGVPDNMLDGPINLASLDPAAFSNFRNAGGILPDLAGGAAGGNGRSAIITTCKLLPGEVRLTKHFIEMAIGTQQTARFSVSGGLTISTGKAAADPINLGEFMSAGLRLRQHAIDYKEWDDDDGYIDVYLHRFIAFDAMFNWKAIAAFDTRFRLEKASSRPGSISSWKDPAIELTQTYFTFNPAAAKHSSKGGGGKGGAGGAGGGAGGGGRGAGKGAGKKKLGNAAWGRQHLNHTEHNGTPLCFHKQRTGSCNRPGCTFAHDICGMCGAAGHVANQCPNGPPPQ